MVNDCGDLGVRLGEVVRLEVVHCGGGEQHGHEAVVSNLGRGVDTAGTARPWAAAAMGARLRPLGGARERVECEGVRAEGRVGVR